jgi:hypothetical protein
MLKCVSSDKKPAPNWDGLFVAWFHARASREKVGTGFSQKRCDNKQIEQGIASELAHLALE